MNKAQKYVNEVIELSYDTKELKSIIGSTASNCIYNGINKREIWIAINSEYPNYKSHRQLEMAFHSTHYHLKFGEPEGFREWAEKKEKEIARFCDNTIRDIDKVMDYLTENRINIRDFRGVGVTTYKKFILDIQNYYDKQ